MTRSLLLLRHAKSDWPPGVADADRPLAPRGERGAQKIGRFLAKNDLVPDRVVASPTRRTRDTAARVLKAASVGRASGSGHGPEVLTDARLYNGEAAEVVAELLPAGGRLLVVGHEPELSDLLMRMTGAQARLPTAALAWLEVDEARLHRLVVEGALGPCAVLQLLVAAKFLDGG